MIGLTRRPDSETGFDRPVPPRVNLLPPEIAEQARLRQVQRGLGAAVVVAVGVVAVLYVGARGSVAEAQTRVETASTEQASVAAQSAKYRDVTAVYARIAAAEQILVDAMGPEVRYSRFLNDLSLSIPENVWVTNASFSQQDAAAATATPRGTGAPAAAAAAAGGLGTVTMSGVAYEHDDVANWLDSLGRQEGYAKPFLTSSTEALIGSRKIVNWTSTATLTPAALSHRYVKAGG